MVQGARWGGGESRRGEGWGSEAGRRRVVAELGCLFCPLAAPAQVLKPALVQLVHAPPPTHAAVAPPLPRPEGQGQLGRQDAAAAAPATTRGPPAHRSRL